eukprot:TRINITY_DN46567_c0_g1_i1.p1 TRINITY_DN46567_c0_g1~~TRINITY_DN46567_c0_g1_i1.p1  ORF type:complete len:963 (-),score=110.23 TRINITY_DN46567_c0_g1_i1:81-2726(-)
MLIGKSVTFKEEYKVDNLQNRPFGVLRFNGQNVAELLVSQGLAKVRGRNSEQEAHLTELQATAKAKGSGQWATDEPPSHHVRFSLSWEPADEEELEPLSKNLQGQIVPGIVEGVLNAAVLRVSLLPSYQYVVVALTGIQPPHLTKNATKEQQVAANEAKFFTEVGLLNKEVHILFEGNTRSQLLGSVVKGAKCFQEDLVERGLVKCGTSGSLSRTQFGAQLQEMETKAKEKKCGVWKNYQPPKNSPQSSAPTKPQPGNSLAGNSSWGQKSAAPTRNLPTTTSIPQFDATVLQVVSGDTLLVEKEATKDAPAQQMKISLSNTRAYRPENAPKVIRYTNFGWDAREFLRTKLIGKTVTVKPDFTRPLVSSKAPDSPSQSTEEERLCACVFYSEEEGNGKNEHNINERLMAQGFAQVFNPQVKSAYFSDLKTAEEEAKKAGRGLWAKDTRPGTRSFDDYYKAPEQAIRGVMHSLTSSENTRRKCIIEQPLSTSCFLISIPANRCMVAFTLNGIQTPSHCDPTTKEADPFGEKALQYCKHHFWQRDAEVEVEGIDAHGRIKGTLYTGGEKDGPPVNIACELLWEGLGWVTDYRTKCSLHQRAAQNSAIKGPRAIWSLAESERPHLMRSRQIHPPKKEKELNVTKVTSGDIPCLVTEVVDSTRMWIQPQSDETKKTLNDVNTLLKGLNLTAAQKQGIKTKDIVVAQFSADKELYRARVTHVDEKEGRYSVHYIDYGNSEIVPRSAIWKVQAVEEFTQAHAGLAMLINLAFMGHLAIDTSIGLDAAFAVRTFCDDNSSSTQYRPMYKDANDGQRVFALLHNGNSMEPIQTQLLAEGMGHLHHDFQPTGKYGKKEFGDLLANLQGEQDTAKSTGTKLWLWGDPYENNE